MKTMLEKINDRLNEIMDSYPEGDVRDAMRYSLMAGGKRIRPVMMLDVIKSYSLDYEPYIDAACAIEMIHTYSLIHDDLPGMDNDDLRRGKPTCHIQFGEGTAILAGDALLNEAANVILHMDIDNDKKIRLLTCLYHASGLHGMVYGQQLDLYYEEKEADQPTLEKIHYHKTGCMIAASLEMGAICADQYEDAKKWSDLGFKIGLAFQIQDDILDVTSSTEVLGKPVGSDDENNKSTYVTLLGLEQSNTLKDQLFNECREMVYGFIINHGIILGIIDKLQKRVN